MRLAEGAVGEQQVGRRELAGCVDAAGGARGGERETGARRGLMLKAGAGGGAGAEPRRQEGRRESCGPYMVWSNWSFFPFFSLYWHLLNVRTKRMSLVCEYTNEILCSLQGSMIVLLII